MKKEIPTPVALAIILVVLVLVVGIGYWYYQSQTEPKIGPVPESAYPKPQAGAPTVQEVGPPPDVVRSAEPGLLPPPTQMKGGK